MKKIYSLLVLLSILFTSNLSAQVTTNSGSGLNANYPSLAAAITALNGATITSPVVITLAGNETAPAGGYSITATGTSTNTIVIAGSSSTITSPTNHVVGNLNDAIFKIIGGDWITIQGFTMVEDAANIVTVAGTNTMTEWGVALLYATTTNGAQNCTIQNNTITLNRTYQNTFGIYSNSAHSATAVSSSASATTTAGGNSGLKIYSNTISNVNNGIVVVGPTAAADFNAGIDIGGASAATANTISNFGTTGTFSSYIAVSGTVFGILVRNSTTINVSYNSVTSSNGGNTVGSLRGIYIPSFSVAPTGTFTHSINNNTVAMTTGVVAGAVQGISVEATTGTATSTTNINGNNFTAIGYNVGSPSGVGTGIINAMANLVISISNNTFTNITSTSTGSFTFISNSVTVPAGGTETISNNSIVTAFSKTGAGGTVTGITRGSSSTTVTQNWANNNFSNMTVTGATALTFINNTDGGTVNHNIIGNTFNNIVGGTGAIIGINSSFGGANGGNGNQVSGNTISNITSAGSISGITIGSSGTTSTVFGNTIFGLSSTGASAVQGITSASPTSANIYKNKIYDLTANNASGTVNGILISAGTLHNVYNNLIGDLKTPASNAANPLVGLNITGGTTVNAYFNTVLLNATSSGALFGSSALSASTTPALTLNNNIFVNNSSVTGLGVAVAYRRSTTTLTTYGATSNSNDFFASPIYTDGTNTDATIGAYKARVASRDASSISENPAFVSTSGANATFLHINTVTPTQLESGGSAVSGITDDFDGDLRNVSTPDIGADEFAGVGQDLSGPTITYTALGNTCAAGNRTLTATITDASGVPTTGVGLPTLYFKIGIGGAYVSSQGTFVSGNQYSFSVGTGSVAGDAVYYYIAAQDNAGNVSVSPSGGAAGFSTNPPAASTPPTTPSTYNVLQSLTGTYTVGATGNYTTLTLAVADYNTKCLGGAVTFSLLNDYSSAGETFPITFNSNIGASAVNTLTIKPGSGFTASISGSLASGALIRLNGASYIIIDGSNNGSTSRDLTITNTNVTAPTAVALVSLGTGLGATNNVIKNCNISTGAQTTLGYGVSIGGSTPGTSGADNDINTIQNNSFTASAVSIYAIGTATGSAGGNDNLNINNNVLTYNGTLSSAIAMRIGNTLNSSISQNTINYETSSTSVAGISLESGTNNTVVSRNTIEKCRTTNTTTISIARGIVLATNLGSSALTIANNVITNVLTSYATSNVGSSHTGILFGATGVGTSYTAPTGGINLYYNSVNMSGNYDRNLNALNYAIFFGSAVTNMDVRNNIFANTTFNINASGTASKSYSIYSQSTSTAFTIINNNIYFASGGQQVLGFLSSDRATIEDWKSATTQDNNSFATDPQFTSASNLTINSGVTPNAVESGGAVVSVTTDFNGNARPFHTGTPNGGGTAPDMGAYEFDGVPLAPCTTPGAQPTSLLLNSTGQTTVTGSYTAVTPAPTNYLVVRTTSSTLAASPVNGTGYSTGTNAFFGAGGFVESVGSGTSISSTGLTQGTTYYYWIFSFNTGNCSGGPNYLAASPLSGSVMTNALFTSIATGNWEDGTTWNQSGAVPASNSDVIIANTHTVTVNGAAANAATVTINSGGILTASGNTLTVGGASTTGITIASGGIFNASGSTINIGPAGGGNRRLSNSGTLSVSGGILNINGNLVVNSGATFNQSGGDINVDGNSGVVGTSVASSTAMVLISSGLGTVTGGVMTIVDPNFNSAGKAFDYNVTTTSNAWGIAHTLRLGDGTSAEASANASGFILEQYTGTGKLNLGNLRISGGNATNRWASLGAWSTFVAGTLTVDANAEIRLNSTSTSPVLSGDVVNNGTITSTVTVILAATSGTSTVVNPNAQLISGAGVFRNSATASTASFVGVTVNNSNLSGVSFAAGLNPSLSGTLTLTAGKLNIGTNTLTLNGSLSASASGTLTGSATSNLSVGGTGALGSIFMDQTTDGTTNVLNNFTLNRITSGTATLGNKLVLLDTYTPTAGVLTTGSFFTLRSTATKTARIAAGGTAYISGNTTIERFIPASGRRAWRLLATPVTAASAPTIMNSWQEGGAPNADANFGTHITQAGGAATNGFDLSTVSINSSIRFWNGTILTTPANTDVTKVSDNGAAYFLFVRGNRAIDINNTSASGNTTLRMTGVPNQGPVTAGVAGASFSLIPNPYPSPVDFEAILAANAGLIGGGNATYYVWDATLGTVGAYRTVERTAPNTYQQTPSGGSTTGDNSSRYIRSGQAFFTNVNTTVNFTESMKTDQLPSFNVYRTNTGTEELEVNLNIVNGTTVLADGVRAKFDDNFSASVNGQDITKLNNLNENLAIARDAATLAVEKRPIVQARDTVFLKLTNTGVKNYQFALNAVNFSTNSLEAFLEDAYLNQRTPVSLTGATTIDFGVTADAASANPDRFRIVFAPSTILPANYTTVKASQKNAGVQVDWTVGGERNVRVYEIEKSADGVQFTKAGTVNARGNNNSTISYDWFDASPVNGMNYYRIKAIDINTAAKFSQVVNVIIGAGKTEISVYPNPVVGNNISLQLNSLPRGQYTIQLFNNLGQQVYQRKIEHLGGSATQTLNFEKVMSKGVYQLQLSGGELNLKQQLIFN